MGTYTEIGIFGLIVSFVLFPVEVSRQRRGPFAAAESWPPHPSAGSSRVSRHLLVSGSFDVFSGGFGPLRGILLVQCLSVVEGILF